MIDRSPYFPKTEKAVETEYAFRPLEKTENIKIYHLADLMLCGHAHTACISASGSEHDELGQPCTIIVGSAFNDRDKSDVNNVVAGAYIWLNDHNAEFTVNTKKQVITREIVKY